jgi:histidine triad (HIT) family protein
MEDSIFTKIINGIIPCYKIAEDDNFIAFLDINTLKEVHTLVVPTIHIDYIYDLPDDILSELFILSKVFAKKI